MTGFGRGSAGRGPSRIDVEIRTVNSRFLELKIRGFGLDPTIEKKVRNLAESSLQRGNVQLRIELKSSQDFPKISFNKARFEMIKEILKKIHVDYGQRLSLSDIISTNDLLIAEESEILKSNTVVKAVELALNQVTQMRVKEGNQIQDDIKLRIEKLQKSMEEIQKISAKFSAEKQSMMRQKISDLLEGEDVDELRLIQEVAFLNERVDVTEEIVRCKSHFSQLSSYLTVEEPVGKRINFLIQEIGREVNTIGSKSPQIEVTNCVVEVKDQLEKIREQAQNIL